MGGQATGREHSDDQSRDRRAGPARGAGTGPAADPEILVLAAVVVLGAIMTILDATIVNVALPTLGRDFHASIATIQWVPTHLPAAFASVIPLTGWASERFGARRLWLASLGPSWPARCCAGCPWSVGVADRVPGGAGHRRRDDHAARPDDPGAGGRAAADGPRDEHRRRAAAARADRRAGDRRRARRRRQLALDLLRQPAGRRGRAGAGLCGCCPTPRGVRRRGSTSAAWRCCPAGIAVLALRPRPGRRRRRHRGALPLVASPPGLARGRFRRSTPLRAEQPLSTCACSRRRGFARGGGGEPRARRRAVRRSRCCCRSTSSSCGGRSPLQTGLLLIPQGARRGRRHAMAGALTDRVGARRVVAGGRRARRWRAPPPTRRSTATRRTGSSPAALLLIGAGLGADDHAVDGGRVRGLDTARSPRAIERDRHHPARRGLARHGAARGRPAARDRAAALPGFHGGIAQARPRWPRPGPALPALAHAFGARSGSRWR